MSKFTPGPWGARLIYRMILRFIDTHSNTQISKKFKFDWADACLMSASPDYHAAAAKLLACPVGSDGFAEGLEMLRMAHAKAEGCEAC